VLLSDFGFSAQRRSSRCRHSGDTRASARFDDERAIVGAIVGAIVAAARLQDPAKVRKSAPAHGPEGLTPCHDAHVGEIATDCAGATDANLHGVLPGSALDYSTPRWNT